MCQKCASFKPLEIGERVRVFFKGNGTITNQEERKGVTVYEIYLDGSDVFAPPVMVTEDRIARIHEND